MMDEKKIEILDSQGNMLNGSKENKYKQFLLENIWNILGTGIATCITIVGMLNVVISKSFADSCENFYGVDRKYFSGTEIFQDKVIFFLCATILFIYPFMFAYMNRKVKSKAFVIFTFFMSVMILFMQNLLYTVSFIDITSWTWLKRIIDNYVTVVIFLLADILIAYFLIIRNYFWKNKKYKKIEKVILLISLTLYILDIAVGISVRMNYQISDKKSYEVIDEDKVIISHYKGKYVVMDCDIQDEILIIKKGSYSMEEMTGMPITYREYQKVVCE